MYATVYCTRSKGVRLPTPSRPQAGQLVFDLRSEGTTKNLAARLLADGSDALVLPELLNARVIKITANGIVITGQEVIPRRTSTKSRVDFWRQTWWCLIHTVAITESLDVLREDSDPFGSVRGL
jgi:hypothetical protein